MQTIKDHFDEARKLFQQVEENGTIENTALSRLKHSVETAYTSFKEEASSWGDDLRNGSNKLCGESAASSNEQISLLQECSSYLSSLVEAIEQQVHTYLRNEQEALSEVQTLAEKMMTREMAHLKRQNELLAQMLVNERKQAEKAKADIVQRVSGMLGEFMQKRDDHLKESIGNLQESNREVEGILASTYQRQTKAHGNLMLRNSKLQSQLSDLNEKGLQAKANNEQVRCYSHLRLITHKIDTIYRPLGKPGTLYKTIL
jgi:kinesin family protein 11